MKKYFMSLLLLLIGMTHVAIAQVPYAVLSDDGKTVTFYYDKQKAKRSGVVAINDMMDGYHAYNSITTAVFDTSFADYRPTSTQCWFYHCAELTTITGIENLKTENVTDMSYMFYGCRRLTSLALSSFKTDNVTNMRGMFMDCYGLTSLDLSGLNNEKVTDMSHMFYNCSGLTSLNLSGFNTANVTDMSFMFLDCKALTNLDVSGFNTDNVTNMEQMFDNCSGLTSLDLSSFNTSNVTDMTYMFHNCSSLMTIYASDGWSTEKLEYVGAPPPMFGLCRNLVGGVGTTYNGYNDINYARIDGGETAPGYFTDGRSYAVLSDDNTVLTFYYDNQKASRNGMGIVPFNATLDPWWYPQHETITTVVFDKSFANNTSFGSTMGWFFNCSKLTTIIGIENLNTANVTNMSRMFEKCSSLTNLDLSGFKTDNVKYMHYMFCDCSSLTSLDLSGFNTGNVTTMEYMFFKCKSLKTIYVGDDWSVENVKYGDNMFYSCWPLVGGQGTTYGFDHNDHTYAHVDGGTANPGYLTNINAPKVDVTLTAKSYTREYGEANPTFEYTVSDGTITSGTPTITCSATATSPVGTYDIVISKGTVTNSGTVNLVKGTLTITKAPLTISAGNYTKKEGEDNPEFAPVFTGFKNNETKAVLTKQPVVTTTATKASKAGNYTVSVSGAEAQNYSISYQTGTLAVTASISAALAVGDYFNDGLLEFKVTSISPNEVSFCGFTKVTDIEGVFTIPSSVKDTDGNSYSVKTIGDYAFFTSANIANMTGVVIPESITNIGKGAFYNCKGLTTITIPSHVTEIGEYAFHKCTNLKSIELSEGVITIGKMAFEECASLSKISIPSSVTSIGENAFEDCSSLTDISFPRGVKNLTLENGAFYKCTGLKNFTIPEGVKSIGTGAFASCTNLESVTIPKGVTECGNGIFLNCTSLTTVVCASNPGNVCFDGCTALTNVTLTDDVTGKLRSTFQNCTSLKSIKIPSSVETLDMTFNRCSSLTDVTLSEGLDSIQQAFRRCTSLKSIVIPSSVTYLNGRDFIESEDLTAVYVNLKSWCSMEEGSGADETWRDKLYLDNVKATEIVDLVIPEGITKLGSVVFTGMTNLKSVTFPASMTDFSTHGNFSNCNALSAINIQDLKAWLSITNFNYANNPLKIAKHLFVKGTEVKDLVIPEGISAINDYAFYGCEGLTSVTIPSSVTSIGNSAFSGCTGLTAVHISDIAAWCGINFRVNPLIIAGHLFMNGKEVTDLAIPEGVTSISERAFSGCKFNSVSIPSSLKAIGVKAFSGANTVYLKDLATWCKIGVGCNLMNNCEHLFINGEEITDLVIPDGVTSISDSVFYNCKAIASVNTGNTVKEIGSYSFAGCDNLKNVTLGSSVTSIEEGAFYNCKELKEVYSYPEEPPFSTSTPYMWTVWYLEGEGNDRYDRTLYVPTGTKAKYVANRWNEYFNNIEEMRNTFTLTYMVDGEEYKSVEVDLGAAITPEAEPTKEGYTFSGWSEVPEMMPANDVTVTGTFAVNKYTLTYKVDGEEYKSHEVEYGAAITPEAEPAKEGYTFSGWSEIPETMPANDVTVTGTFAVNKYTLTYKVDGEEYKSHEVEYGAAITPEAEPTKEGYTFSGWSEIPETMPANDVTIIGKFTENPIVIDIEPVGAEENINVNNLDGEELSDKVVGNVYYNVGDDGYDSTDKSIVISQPTNMSQIANKEPGSADVKENFNGMILKVAKGKGLITVNVKTSGNAQLVVQVGNGTPMLASKTEKGDVVFRYDVEEDTYVYIYAIIGSSAAKGYGINAADTESSVRIYSITVSPGATGIRSIGASEKNDGNIYDLQGHRVETPAKGIYIIGGRKVAVK